MTNKKVTEATDFIKFLINSTSIYKVDDDNYIRSISENKKITFPTKDNDDCFIKVISSGYKKNNNIIILNPYHETLKKTNIQKWFFSALSLSISMKLKKMLLCLIDFNDIQESLPIEQIKELSPYLNNIGKRTYKDVEKITKELVDFANIYYNRKIRIAYFRTGVFEKSFINKFKSITKKSKEFIEKFLSNLFEIDETLDIENKRLALKEKYKSSTTKITCPEFITFINTYYKILNQINNKLDYFGLEEYIVDMSQFAYYLKNIDDYYDKTKWLSEIDNNKIKKNENQSNNIIPDNTLIQTNINNDNDDSDSSIIPKDYNINMLMNQSVNPMLANVDSVFPGTLPFNNTQNQFINNSQFQFPNIQNQPINTLQQPIGIQNQQIIPTNNNRSLF